MTIRILAALAVTAIASGADARVLELVDYLDWETVLTS